MRKKLMLVLCLVLCAAVMAGCAGGNEKERFDVITQQTQGIHYGGNMPSPSAAPEIDYDDGSYDPGQEEEDNGEFISGSIFDSTFAPAMQLTPAPTMNSQYAGASPVVIDPIDKPTPTPLPALTFTYQAYDAKKLHLSFEAPIGWQVDDVSGDTYVLTQPKNEAVPGYQAMMTVRASAVNSQFDTSDLSREVTQMLDTIGAEGFSDFDKSRTAQRTLLDKAGVYANYTAKTLDGVEVAGRVHATCIDKVLYTVHVTYPRGYRDTFVDQVYGQFRKTVKITK